MKSIGYTLAGLAILMAVKKKGSSFKKSPQFDLFKEESAKPEFYIAISDYAEGNRNWERNRPTKFARIFGPFEDKEAEAIIGHMTSFLREHMIKHQPFRPKSYGGKLEPWYRLATGIKPQFKGKATKSPIHLTASIMPSVGWWLAYISLGNDLSDPPEYINWGMFVFQHDPNLKRTKMPDGKPAFEVLQPLSEAGTLIPILPKADWYRPGWHNKIPPGTRKFFKLPPYIPES